MRFREEIQEVLRRQFLVAAFALGLSALGCGAGERERPEDAPASSAAIAPKLERPWADHYGGAPGPVALTELEQELWSAVMAKSAAACCLDPRLVLAARQLARDLSSHPRGSSDADLDRLRFVLLRLGGADYTLHPFAAASDPAGRQALARLVAERKTSLSHCGIGATGADPGAKMALVCVQRLVELDPVPSTPAPGAPLVVSGILKVQGGSPVQAFVGRPDGSVVELPSARTDGGSRFSFRLSLGGPGRYDLELLVDAGRGPETAVLIPLFVGVAADRLATSAPDGAEAEADRPPETALLAFSNRARSAAGIQPLVRDGRLDALAARHSAEMVARGFFGHVSPTEGSLADRLGRASLSLAKSAENIARSGSVLRIHRNLLASPSHRINLLDPEFTHVGIGVAQDGDGWVATQIFAKW